MTASMTAVNIHEKIQNSLAESVFDLHTALPYRNSSQFCLIASYHNLALNQPLSLNYQRLFGVGEYEYFLHS